MDLTEEVPTAAPSAAPPAAPTAAPKTNMRPADMLQKCEDMLQRAAAPSAAAAAPAPTAAPESSTYAKALEKARLLKEKTEAKKKVIAAAHQRQQLEKMEAAAPTAAPTESPTAAPSIHI